MLDKPFAELRVGLEGDGWSFTIPDRVSDQIRAAFRFDLAQMGVDTGESDQVASALAGLGIALKALSVMGVATPPVTMQIVMLYEIARPLLDSDIDAEVDRLAPSWLGFEEPPGERGRAGALPDLPKIPTSDKPVMTDMSGWAAAMGAAQPDLHMTPEEIVEKAKHGRPFQRPTIGGPGFARGPDAEGMGVASPEPSGGDEPPPYDDDEVVDGEIVDDAIPEHPDEERWDPPPMEPRRAQRRSWWQRRP